MASEGSDASAWTWAAMEPAPTEDERRLYDLFVTEYLHDGNATRAASRCGFQPGFAEEWGKRLFQRSYVQQRIRALNMRKVDTPDEVEHDHSMSIAVLRKVATNEYERGAARVAAVKQIAAMRGFNAPVKSQVDVSQRGGVILVPGIATLDDWEATAAASQSALAEASRVS